MLHGAIRQLFSDVDWGVNLDYMIVDLPPGTGDAPLSLAQSFPLTGVPHRHAATGGGRRRC